MSFGLSESCMKAAPATFCQQHNQAKKKALTTPVIASRNLWEYFTEVSKEK